MLDLSKNAPSLNHTVRLKLSDRLRSKITAALNEETAYAADELVDVAEEVLRHLAALGIAHYLRESPQKEIYNDFLLELFEEGVKTSPIQLQL